MSTTVCITETINFGFWDEYDREVSLIGVIQPQNSGGSRFVRLYLSTFTVPPFFTAYMPLGTDIFPRLSRYLPL